eukprot:TRINITY_DN19288_c0_g1_i1.p1 TRINITY_DN19288_c0_g1~~TRINITY_DN19288_c0_g1_i1.p1  ORF type:complete len:121 (-),score=19.12 TRINITY_DN19288_c0_g1_i1:53-364(-)
MAPRFLSPSLRTCLFFLIAASTVVGGAANAQQEGPWIPIVKVKKDGLSPEAVGGFILAHTLTGVLLIIIALALGKLYSDTFELRRQVEDLTAELNALDAKNKV